MKLCSVILLFAAALSLAQKAVASLTLPVSAGRDQTLFVKVDRTLWATGNNQYGQLGDGTTTNRVSPVLVATNVASVSAGQYHTLFVKTDGTLWATGNNQYGQLGDGTTTNRASPVLVATNVASVSAGGYHTLFVRTDGTLWATGNNGNGQIGDGDHTNRTSPVLVATKVASVSTGYASTLFVKTDGSLWATGANGDGELGDGTGAERISPVLVTTNVTSVSSGAQHTLIVKTDGTLWATGANYLGHLGDGTTIGRLSPVLVATNVSSVTAGSNYTLFVKTDGTLWATGYNNEGEFGDGTTTNRISAVFVTTNVAAVSAGSGHTLFVRTDGTLWGTGYNHYGELGDGTTINRISPVQVATNLLLKTFSKIAITPNGTLAFSTVQAGKTVEQTVRVANASNVNVNGSASISAPFSIVSGGIYSLAAGQSQNVVVRYSPTAAGNSSTAITFTDGQNTLSRQVTGSAFTDPTPLTGTLTGRVVDSQTGDPIPGVRISLTSSDSAVTSINPSARALTAKATASNSSPSFGPTALGAYSASKGANLGNYKVSNLTPNKNYQIFAQAGTQQYAPINLSNVAITAGSTVTKDIKLDPIQSTNFSMETPVVLVRGTGKDTDWGKGDSGYWSEMRTFLATNGFLEIWDCNEPNANNGLPGHVINGENSIADNSRSLFNYLRQKLTLYYILHEKTYPRKISFVCHSMGGLIVRDFLQKYSLISETLSEGGASISIPTKIDKVIMVGTPNGGSRLAEDAKVLFGIPLADVREGQSLWPATDNLRISYIVYKFNPSNSFPTDVELDLIAGTGGPTSGDEGLQAGAKIILSSPFADSQNDGAVERISVSGQYKSLSSVAPLSSFRANPRFTLVDTDITATAQDHFSLLKDTSVAEAIVKLLRGTFSTGTKAISRKASALKSVKSASVISATSQIFELLTSDTQSQASEIFIPSDATTKLTFFCSKNNPAVPLSLYDPNGSLVQESTDVQISSISGDDGYLSTTYVITSPAKGLWKVTVDGSTTPSTPASYSLMVTGDSTISLSPQTASVVNRGQDMVVACAINDSATSPATPILNASVSSSIVFPDSAINTLTLLDDGLHNDGAPNDGVYAAVIPNVQQAGEYSISYRAEAKNNQDQPFQRVATGEFSVSSENANIWGDPVFEKLDTDGDDIDDKLQAKSFVNPKVAGDYTLAGDLVSADGSVRVGDSEPFHSDGSGPVAVSLFFDLKAINRAASSQYHIENLQLFETTTDGTAWLDAYRGQASIQLSGLATVAMPTISPAGGIFTSEQTVILACDTTDAVIHYTNDGSDPTENSFTYSVPLLVSNSATINAKAFKDGSTASDIATADFIISTTSTPSPTPTTPSPTPAPTSSTYQKKLTALKTKLANAKDIEDPDVRARTIARIKKQIKKLKHQKH